MACSGSNWDVVARSQTEELIGGTRVERATEWGVITQPSGTFFQVRVPVANQDCAGVGSLLDYLAIGVENVAADPYVQGLVYIQDVQPGGQLRDLFEITVCELDTDICGTITVLVTQIGEPGTQEAMAAELNAMRG